LTNGMKREALVQLQIAECAATTASSQVKEASHRLLSLGDESLVQEATSLIQELDKISERLRILKGKIVLLS